MNKNLKQQLFETRVVKINHEQSNTIDCPVILVSKSMASSELNTFCSLRCYMYPIIAASLQAIEYCA